MRLLIFTSIFFIFGQNLHALTFDEAMKAIEAHGKVVGLRNKSSALIQASKEKASWADPVLKVAAKNYPIRDFTSKKVPMTGIDIVISQSLPLTGKYENLRQELEHLSKAEVWLAMSEVQQLRSFFWEKLINIKRLNEEIEILKANLNWLENIIAVSQDLYSTGEQSQQVLLELKIRKSELKSALLTREFELEDNNTSINYVTNSDSPIELTSVPWEFLSKSTKKVDPNEEYLVSRLNSARSLVLASDQDRIPDLSLSVGYTKRPDIDQSGDFITIAASLPFPFSDKKQASFAKALLEQKQSEIKLADYRKEKFSKMARLKLKKDRILSEIELLESESIVYAENSLQITTTSYQLGKSSYIELLQSELRLQNLNMRRVDMRSKLLEVELSTKLLSGEQLYE